MIHDINDDIHPFDDPAREREWLAQENAMRRQRLQLDPCSDDARTQRYRLLAHVLRQPSSECLPADFARRVAAQIGATRQPSLNTPFELGLIISLYIALLVALVVVLVPDSGQWWRSLVALPLPAMSSLRLLFALAGCIAVTWLLGQWQTSARKR
ncbi:MAG: hypothetical protein ABI870_01680 [Rhodanobacter sp.]